MNRITTALNVYEAVRGYNLAEDTTAWANANPGLFQLWAKVEKLKNGR